MNRPRQPRLPHRRLASALGAVAALLLVQAVWAAQVQPQQAPVNRNRFNPAQIFFPNANNEAKEDAFTSSVKLPVDPRAKRKLEMAKQYVKSQDWTQAIKLLQSLLDGKEDVFLQEEGKSRRLSVRAEASRLVGALPKEGLQFYEQEYGVPARIQLRKGQEAGDPQIFADVALRYLHTEAGAEAAALLGAYHLDQGQYITAALCFERLQGRAGGLGTLSPLLLFKAALAFERSGDAVARDRAWLLLDQKLDQPGEAPLPPTLAKLGKAGLRAALERKGDYLAASRTANWPMFLGSPDRTALGIGSVPYLEPRLGFPIDSTRSLLDKSPTPEAARSWLDQAIRKQIAMNWPLLGGSHPLAVGDLLIYRGAWGLHAVDVKTGKLKWESRSKVGLAAMASPRGGLQDGSLVSTWLDYYRGQFPWLFFDNSMIGTLSADQSLVYAVEDLAVPPTASATYGAFPNQMGNRVGGEVGKWMQHNKLIAYELGEGAIAWEIGSPDGGTPYDDTFFLGCPLPLGDKLYTLAEAGGEIKLLCLQTQRTWDAAAGRNKYAVELVWSQALCLVNSKLTEQPLRRTQAIQLAYSDGILVCPTHAGVVIGVDLLTRSLVWAHAYQVQDAQAANEFEGAPFIPGMGRQRRFAQVGGLGSSYPSANFGKPAWGVAAPMIAQGLIVFTAPDAKFVHALALKDGVEVWRHNLENKAKAADLFLGGVVDGKVLIVGQSSLRALELKTGKATWSLPIGTPNGRGVASESIYYLPIRTGDSKNQDGGEVWAIDVAKGVVLSRSRSKAEAPGNLIFHDGELISQNILKVVVYPQLSAKEAEISVRLERNPKDPSGLAQRGEMRLYRGDLLAAAGDLRAALGQPDIAPAERRRAREKLYDALYELLDKEFAKHEADLGDLALLVAIDPADGENDEAKKKREDEQLDRKAKLLRLVAKGRQAQGKLQSALTAYLEFAGLGGQLITSPEDATLLVAPVVWAQGRVQAMIKTADAAQKRELETAFENEWQTAKKADAIEPLRRFAEFYAPLCAQGREAQLALAERLAAEKQWLEACTLLNLVIQDADAGRAARGHEALARLFTAQGELENAAYYYKALAQRFPKTVVRDGKTGEQLYLELTTDKRFLPYLSSLDGAKRGLMGQLYQRIEQLEPRQVYNQTGGRRQVWLDPAGPVPPLFEKFRVGVDMDRRQVRIVDRGTDEERRTFTLQSFPFAFSSQVRPGGSYQAVGQVLVFSWGNFIYAYDLLGGRVLWSQDLLAGYEPPGNAYAGYPQMQLLPEQNGRFKLISMHNTQEWVGMLGVAEAAGVCFTQKDRGLVMVDLLTGKERWVKTDVSTSMELFGDAEQVFLAPPKRERKGRAASALRVLDGAVATVPDFLRQYDAKLRIVGRHLLLKEGDEEVSLRLFDPAAGKEVWALPLGKDGVVLNSLDPKAAGGIEADGRLTVVDLLTGKPLLKAKVDDSKLKDFLQLHLLSDADAWYVFGNQPVDTPKDVGKTLIKRAPNQFGFQELRMVDVHGPAYSFSRQTGQLRWRTELPVQALIVEQFDETPMFLCACTLQAWKTSERMRGGYRLYSSAAAFDKRDGKMVGSGPYERDNNPYVDLRLDAAAGQVELIGMNNKVAFQLVNDPAAK